MNPVPSMYLSPEEIDPQKIFQGDIFREPVPSFYLPNKNFNLYRFTDGIWHEYTENELTEKGKKVWLEDEFIMVRARKKKIIIISQSCDIHEERFTNLQLSDGQEFKNPFLIYAPIYSLEEVTGRKQDLRQNKLLHAFYLEKNEDLAIEESVVWLTHFCSILKSRVNRFTTFGLENRIASLRPPWREALAHRVGNLFSRVAIPSEVVFT